MSVANAAPLTTHPQLYPAVAGIQTDGRRPQGLVLLAVGRVSIVLAAIASVRAMTTLLSPAEVGHYSVVTTFAMWFSLTLVSPSGNYINRRLMDWVYAGVIWRELRKYLLLLLLTAVFTAAISYIGQQTTWLDTGETAMVLILCVVGILVFLTVNTMVIGFLNLLGRRNSYVLYTSATAWIGLVMSVVLTLRFGYGVELWIAGQVLGWALVAVPAFVCLRRTVAISQVVLRTTPAEQNGLWAFVWPLIISTSLYWFQVQGYRIELEHWVSFSAVGLLMTGLVLGANPVTIIDTLLGEYLRPQYLQAISGNDRAMQEAAWSDMATTFLSILIPVAVFVGFSGPFITALLVGSAFQSVSGLVAWGVLLEFSRAVNSMYVAAAHTRYKTRVTLTPAIVGSAIVLISIVPLARWNLYNGTGLALVIGMSASTAYLALNLKPVFTTRISLPKLVQSLRRSGPVAIGLVAVQFVLRHPSQVQAVIVLTVFCIATLGLQMRGNQFLLPLITKTGAKQA